MKSPITTCALILPILCLVFGFMHAFVTPIETNDWLGMGFWARAFYAVLIASFVSVFFSVWAFGRKEKEAGKTLIFSMLGSLIIVCVAVFLAEHFISQKRSKRETDVFRKTYAEIQNDPTILRSTNWLNVSAPERRAFTNSFKFGTGPYSEDDIIYVYNTYYPTFLICVFQHPACPTYLLEKHFEEALGLFKSGESYHMLEVICSNENTPRKLLEKVASETAASHSSHKTLNKLSAKKLQNKTK